MQLLFHDDKMQNVLLPINCELKVRTNRFFTEGSFIERDKPIEIVNVDGARIVVRERQSA